MTLKKKNFVNFLFVEKVIIFDSFFKPALKNLFILFGNKKVIIFVLFSAPIVTYFNFNKNKDCQKLFAVFDKTLPASTIPCHEIRWDTFQKNQTFPITPLHADINTTSKTYGPLETALFQSSVTKIDYWGNFMTVEYTKKWDHYKKQYFFGLINSPNRENTQPLIVSARDNFQSRFYSCLLNTTKNNGVINKFQTKFYNGDEFALKLESIHDFQTNGTILTSPLLIPRSSNKHIPLVTSEKKLSVTNDTNFFRDKSIEKVSTLNRGFNEFSLTGNQNFVNQPSLKNLNITNLTNEKFLQQLSKNQKIFATQATLQNTFFKSGYFHAYQSLEEKNPNFDLITQAVSNTKWAGIAVDQVITILKTLTNVTDSRQLTDSISIANSLDKKLILENSFAARQMSGFQSPDSTLKEFLDFQQRNNFFLQNDNLRFLFDSPIKSKIKIFFGDHFIWPNYYTDPKVEPLKLKLNYYSATFEGENNQIKYQGPTVFPIPETKLTQRENQFTVLPNSENQISELKEAHFKIAKEMSLANASHDYTQIQNEIQKTSFGKDSTDFLAFVASNWWEVKANLSQLFDKNDPRQSTQKYFFDLLHINHAGLKTQTQQNLSVSGDVKPNYTFIEAQKEKFYIQYITDKNKSSERSTKLVSSPRRYSYNFVVPYINTSAWNLWLSKSNAFPLSVVPVRQISSLRNSHIDQSFDNLDYQCPVKMFDSISNQTNLLPKQVDKAKPIDFYDTINRDWQPLFNLVNPVQINYHEFPISQSCFSTEFLRKNFSNISYLKSVNQYIQPEDKLQSNLLIDIENQFKDVNTTKKQIWEPLHEDSWMIISQYLFALLIFSILRQLTASYGRELIAYLIEFISSLGIIDDSFKDGLTSDESKYRIIREPNTGFRNIAGINQIFAQLAELVWFLRSSKNVQNLKAILPKGILLVGPPGTGKTLLVKAIAGEAQTPIFLQPAGSFTNVSGQGLGAQRLQKLFEKANEYAPCIIFFDEIDSIGKRRSHIIQDSQNECLFQFVTNSIKPVNVKPLSSPVELDYEEFSGDFYSEEDRSSSLNSDIAKLNGQSDSDSESLSLLMQLLIELDGLNSSRQVIVMGATNRLDVLDPALVRPGRFDKVLKLGLPKKTKRIQICQLYAKILGTESSISWDYIGRKTIGLSGADLATIMNQSAIDAILHDSKHTTRTIDIAIDKVINDTNELLDQTCYQDLNRDLHEISPTLDSTLMPRLAYYEVGKVFLTIISTEIETAISCSLNGQKPNSRYQKVLNTFLSAQFLRADYPKLKQKIMSLLGGHICESFYFRKGLVSSFVHSNFAHSDFGNTDLIQASNLIYQIIDQWYLDSNNFCFEKLFYFEPTHNKIEIESKNLSDVLGNILEKQLEQANQDNANFRLCDYEFHNWSGKSNWQIYVSQQSASGISLSTINYSNWYRINMKNPTETIRNDEWIVPDMYYHADQAFFLTKTLGLTELTIQKRDLLYKKLLEACFQEASILILHHSMFVDFLVNLVLKYQSVQQVDMQEYWNQFYSTT